MFTTIVVKHGSIPTHEFAVASPPVWIYALTFQQKIFDRLLFRLRSGCFIAQFRKDWRRLHFIKLLLPSDQILTAS